jgi:hypothetical protein
MTKEFTIKVNVPSGKVLTDVVERTVNGETVFVPVFENKALFKPGDFIYNPETKHGGIFAAVRKNVLYVYVFDEELKATVEDSAGKPNAWEHAPEKAIVEYQKVLSKHGLSWNADTLSYETVAKTENSGTPYKKGDKYFAITPMGIKECVWEDSSMDHLYTLLPSMHSSKREDLIKRLVEHIGNM